MKLGMLTAEIRRPTVEALFEAIGAYGFSEVQFGFGSVGEEAMPAHIDPALTARIYGAASANGVDIVAVNGTYNMIHPDPAVRDEGLERFEVVAAACQGLHCNLVTLCTGSRSLEGMWRWHDDNLLPDAWDDLAVSMRQVLAIADRYDLLLGIETEASNVVNTPARTRHLIDEIGSPRLKVIMDVANLFQPGEARPENVRPIIDNVFALLGNDIAIAHGKDIKAGDGLTFTHAGNGIVDFAYFVEELHETGHTGGMLLHGIKDEHFFPQSVAFMNDIIARYEQ